MALALAFLSAPAAHAGGSGLNTVVVVNQNSTNSLALGNYYCERRQVPPGNLLRISWPGPNTVWAFTDFQTNLVQPLLTMLNSQQLTNQVSFVVLSMDIPFQTTASNSTVNSTTAALFYGLKPDTNTYGGYANSYAYREAIFSLAQPSYNPGYSFLATMITGTSLAEAEQIVDQGVSGDATFPNLPVVLEKTDDQNRNIRYSEFDNAIFNGKTLGKTFIIRTNSDSVPSPGPVFGYQTGLQSLTLPTNTFAPGAMADNLTSFSGVIFGGSGGQTTALAFTGAGAAGSYGTVAEPLSDPQKFPNSLDYFYQLRGFSVAECYYQALSDPFLGLVVGEPLSAPFAQPGTGRWRGVASNAVLSGTVQLSPSFSARPGHPLEQIDLFVDGNYLETVTNLAPVAGNQLNVTLSGYPIAYAVPTNSSVAMATAGLAAQINTSSNLTKVSAITHGDRIELHSLSTNYLADPYYFLDASATNGAAYYYRVSYLPFPDLPQLSPSGFDRSSGAFHWNVETAPGVPFVVQASTNLVTWSPVATNLTGGSQAFTDPSAAMFPQRFYRVSAADQHPVMSLAVGSNGGFALHIQSQTVQGYTLLISSNLTDWVPVSTNTTGGSVDFFDPAATNASARFYRAAILPPALAPAQLNVTPSPSEIGNLIAVSGAARPYTVDVSTNLTDWTTLATNSVLTGGQVLAGSSAGGAPVLSTFLTASQPSMLDSPACGLRLFSMGGTARTNSWINFLITKTNGVTVAFGVTNSSGTMSLAAMGQQIFAAVNSSPALQGSDGVVAEDFWTSPVGNPQFHLRAISPGYNAANVFVSVGASSGIGLSPSQGALSYNLSDLQPRNNLFVSAGAASLSPSFVLDTTALADGFHDLTAVAYEGTHVHTQTPLPLPIQVQNTALSATLSALDLPPMAPVQGTYHLQVAANTNALGADSVSFIGLFSTGGFYAGATNQPAYTFQVNGPELGIGLHPFYAVVQTAGGLSYRTATYWARLE